MKYNFIEIEVDDICVFIQSWIIPRLELIIIIPQCVILTGTALSATFVLPAKSIAA